MASNYQITYNVDMVFCIDCTGSMGNIIEMVKKNALNYGCLCSLYYFSGWRIFSGELFASGEGNSQLTTSQLMLGEEIDPGHKWWF